MPSFQFTAYNELGELIKETITAESKSNAVIEIEKRNLLIESISPHVFELGNSKKASSKEFFRINKKLITLLKAGISLPETISIVAEQSDSTLGRCFKAVRLDLINGTTFYEACEKLPETFDEIFISLVKTGEATGNLLDALTEYQNYLKIKIDTSSTIKQALIYPSFLIFAIVIVISILLIFVVPNFSSLYESFGSELPFATKIVVNASKMAPLIVFSLVVIFISTLIFKHSITLSVQMKIRVDKIFDSIPIYGKTRKANQLASVLRMVSSMLAAGLTLVESLRSVKNTFIHKQIGFEIDLVVKDILSGKSFADSLRNIHQIDDQSLKMISIGEKSGALYEMLVDVASYNEEVFKERLKIFTVLIEPVLMLILGILVGGVIISMYLPIFQLSEIVH